MDVRKSRIQQVFGVAAVIGLLFAGGCASSKMTAQMSGEKIFQADKAFSEAKDGNASQNATEALTFAEGKLKRAKEAFGKKNYDEAADLAEQAVVDSNYALSRATTQKNLNVAEGIKKESDVLRQQIQQMSK